MFFETFFLRLCDGFKIKLLILRLRWMVSLHVRLQDPISRCDLISNFGGIGSREI